MKLNFPFIFTHIEREKSSSGNTQNDGESQRHQNLFFVLLSIEQWRKRRGNYNLCLFYQNNYILYLFFILFIYILFFKFIIYI